ncbi:hypothetical protein [Eubacterium sp. MSJ-33]|uniref:hypothetical protein n=1 Tax=Eubacterium sp. MSJ-33 TaxID=2841528 RepID=UPI001C796FAC|nr:hypothetical protein [Eubacterium sp. MSJ-33]QWT52175.1 hypothetical protein KP625_08730 [Eubacterium sp. MSJ-33]
MEQAKEIYLSKSTFYVRDICTNEGAYVFFYMKRVMIRGKLPIILLKNRNSRQLLLTKYRKKEGAI